MSNPNLGSIKRTRGQKLSSLRRVKSRALILMDTHGSRTQLSSLLKDLDEAMDALSQVNSELIVALEDQEEEISKAGEYEQAAVEDCEQLKQQIHSHLKSRAHEAPSLSVSSAGSKASKASSIARAAEVQSKVLELEKRQLEKRLSLKEEEQKLSRQLELKEKEDAVEAAHLRAELSKMAVDSLSWERQNDFLVEDGAVGPVEVAVAGPVEEVLDRVKHPGITPPDRQNQTPDSSLSLRGLPSLTLPKFSGSAAEWPRWQALFKSLVHEKKGLSLTEKMIYLQSSVTGLAQCVIGGMLYSGELYQEAWKALEDRFGKEGDVVSSHLQQIFTCPAPSNMDSVGLERFHATLHCAITVLTNHGYQGDLHSQENLRRIIGRLPVELRKKWAEHVVETELDRPDLLQFEIWMRKQVRVALNCAAFNQPHRYHDRTKSNQPSHGPSARATLVTSVSYPQNGCVCCQQAHDVRDCPSFRKKNVDDRAKLIAQSKSCFFCLKPGHRVNNCRFAKPCGVDACRMRHHRLLHGSRRISFPLQEAAEAPAAENRVVAAVANTSSSVTLLQIVAVRIHGEEGHFRDTLALLDPGSQTSLCSEAVTADLNISGEEQELCLGNVEGSGVVKISRRMQLTLSPLSADEDVEKRILVPEAFSVPNVNVKPQQVPKGLFKDWKHLDGISLPDYTHGTVEVLLGANVLEAVLQREVKVGRPGQPVAIRTAFGWTLTGSVASLIPHHTRQVMFIQRDVPDADADQLTQCVQDWWLTESFGTRCDIKQAASLEDQRALRILEKTVKKTGERYEAGLLWKPEKVQMPDNRSAALSRLKSLERSLARNSVRAEAYNNGIHAYVEAGHARKLSAEEAAVPDDKLWLLAHHGVQSPAKPKMRIVFDAAATYQGVSLNSQLLKGPDLLQNLLGILLRFREEAIALVADIAQMFHQIKIRTEDQAALSFWWRDMDVTRPPDMYRMQVAIFGSKSSPAIANYVLRKTADDGCTGTTASQKAVEAVKNSFYMDDFVKSESNTEAAKAIQEEVTSLLASGGFRLTKWLSNSEDVLNNIPPQERGVLKPDANCPSKNIASVLGCRWDPAMDTIGVKLPKLDVPPTKRGVLKQTAAVYDVIGILAPFVLLAKVLVQKLWQRKCDWDDQLTEGELQTWKLWQSELQLIESISIPRWYGKMAPTADVTRELHLFSDASEDAFGAVAYVRMVTPETSHCELIMARTRLAPLKQLTIVRLELQGAVLAVRLADTIKKEMNYEFKRTLFWTDSQVVLQFLQQESRRYHTFVANRVAEIHESTRPEEWRYVPGPENPADICSRGKTASELKVSQSWWHGPTFLTESEDAWPRLGNLEQLNTDYPEVKKPAVYVTTNAPPEIATSNLLDPKRFSSWLKYRRVLGWVMRFISNSRAKVAGQAKMTGPLRNSELVSVEVCILKSEQRVVSNGGNMRDLSPFCDNHGLLRVGGRLTNAPLGESARHPVILPANSEITRLIITDTHQKVFHSGLERTLCELREQYWVPKMRSVVKRLLRKCAFCHKRRAKPQPPRMADLPEARFDMSRPFSSVGIDYFGALTVKKFRKTEKRYVLLITCLSTRAVHLELAAEMDTSCFIMALRRFIARRGRPRVIYSDNGRNFVGGEKELRQCIQSWNQAQIVDALSQRNIEWVFNPPGAPHMGGVWERLVASVKRALKVVLGNQCVSEDVLHTVLTEVEYMINGRPLTYVSGDSEDPEPLTPNNFLIGASDGNEGLPPGIFNEGDQLGKKKWRQSQILSEHLWKRWRKEYVPFLASRQKWRAESDKLQVGDVVLLTEEGCPRGYWPLGRIVKVFPGSDGRVRSAEVQTKGGKYIRPATKLCVLESL